MHGRRVPGDASRRHWPSGLRGERRWGAGAHALPKLRGLGVQHGGAQRGRRRPRREGAGARCGDATAGRRGGRRRRGPAVRPLAGGPFAGVDVFDLRLGRHAPPHKLHHGRHQDLPSKVWHGGAHRPQRPAPRTRPGRRGLQALEGLPLPRGAAKTRGTGGAPPDGRHWPRARGHRHLCVEALGLRVRGAISSRPGLRGVVEGLADPRLLCPRSSTPGAYKLGPRLRFGMQAQRHGRVFAAGLKGHKLLLERYLRRGLAG
mmetsp:Transcript_29891/g.85624  ORF Transcript_29891/g.85624 Transcript_29891/m.85624 type:complete len:260 (+) Transcript_29891:226-1005(+)